MSFNKLCKVTINHQYSLVGYIDYVSYGDLHNIRSIKMRVPTDYEEDLLYAVRHSVCDIQAEIINPLLGGDGMWRVSLKHYSIYNIQILDPVEQFFNEIANDQKF